jgi:surface-anchored protein
VAASLCEPFSERLWFPLLAQTGLAEGGWTIRRRPKAIAIAVLALVGVLSIGGGRASAAPLPDRTVLSVGHTDALDVHLVDGQLDLMVKDDTGGAPVERAVDDVLFHAKPESEMVLPALPPAWNFLGSAGESVWILPQTADPNLLWPGWETMAVPGGAVVGNELSFELSGVRGPGNFHLYLVDAFSNPTVLYDSTQAMPQTMTVPTGVHAHANWAFGAEGLYELTFEVHAEATGGGDLSTGAARYLFFVGDLADLPATALSVTGAEGEYEPGDEVVLTAVQDPETDLDHFHWFTRCTPEGDFEVVPGAGGGTYSFTATTELEGCEYVAELYTDDHISVAESAPVTLHVHGHEPMTNLSVTGAEGEFEPGDEVVLTAVQDPQTDLDHYHWFVRCPPATEYEIAPAEAGATYTFTATDELEGCEFVAKLYGEGHEVVAESAPVTLHVHGHHGEPFSDVPADHPFAADIDWLADEGISTGYEDGTFRPAASISREAMAAFLYRFAGSPDGADPFCEVAPFTDVAVTNAFCGEIAWLAGTGITEGHADGTFRPVDAVSRQAMAAFLYRFDGEPDGADPHCEAAPFGGVPVGHPFCGEISWLTDAGIAEGYPDGDYLPAAEVSRQAMAAFLHRLSELPVG